MNTLLMLYEERKENHTSHRGFQFIPISISIQKKSKERENKPSILLKNPKLLKKEFFCCYGNTENKG